MLPNTAEDNEKQYRPARNQAMSRQIHQDLWDQFIPIMDNDLHGRNQFIHKIIRTITNNG